MDVDAVDREGAVDLKHSIQGDWAGGGR